MFSLKTSRLLLRDWVDDDWPLIATLAGDPSVTRYQTRLRLGGEDACRRWLTDAIHTNDQQPRISYSLAVVLRETASPIGWLNWEDSEDPARGDVSFGYALLPSMWRRGYMSEAVLVMMEYVFEVQRRDSIYATCATSNPASAGVLEKAGLKLVERWIHGDDDLGIAEEYRLYRVNRAEWRL